MFYIPPGVVFVRMGILPRAGQARQCRRLRKLEKISQNPPYQSKKGNTSYAQISEIISFFFLIQPLLALSRIFFFPSYTPLGNFFFMQRWNFSQAAGSQETQTWVMKIKSWGDREEQWEFPVLVGIASLFFNVLCLFNACNGLLMLLEYSFLRRHHIQPSF